MKRMFIFIALIVCISATNTSANDISFLNFCSFMQMKENELTKDEKAVTISCVAFIKGVVETHNTLMNREKSKPLFCKPPRVTYGDLGRIYADYAKKHTPKPGLSEAEILIAALQDTYPCR